MSQTIGKQGKKITDRNYKSYVEKNLKGGFEEISERKIKALEKLQAEELIKIFLCYAWNTLVLVSINLFVYSQYLLDFLP